MQTEGTHMHRLPQYKQTAVLLRQQLKPKWRECETTKSVRGFQSVTTQRRKDIGTSGCMEIKVKTQDLLPEKLWSCRCIRSLRKLRLKFSNTIMYQKESAWIASKGSKIMFIKIPFISRWLECCRIFGYPSLKMVNFILFCCRSKIETSKNQLCSTHNYCWGME